MRPRLRRTWRNTVFRLKHGVSFEEATTVFGDPLALAFNDPDHSLDEHCLLTFGVLDRNRVLLVVNVERGRILRIISARKAGG